MKIRYLIFFVVAFAAGIVIFFARPVVSPQKLSAQIYSSTQAPFTFQPPEGWIVDDHGTNGTLVIFVNPTQDREGDFRLSASINILSEPLQGLSQEEYIRTSEKNLMQFHKDYRITSDEGHIFEARFISEGHLIRNRQLFVFTEDTAYIITGSSLEAQWDAYKQVIQDSLETFAIVAK